MARCKSCGYEMTGERFERMVPWSLRRDGVDR